VDHELETDDWDDWGEGGDGDVEMQPPFKDDHSLTRRTSGDKSFEDDDDFGWGGSSLTPTPQFVPKRSPRATPRKIQGTEGASPLPNPPFSAARLPTAPRSSPSGLGLSVAQTPAPAAVPTPPMSAPVGAQRITNLGEKKQKQKPEPKKEDDIFASMGLSVKPKFSPATKPTAASRSTGGSRWAQTTTTMGATTATTKTTSSTNFGAAELKATGSMDYDEDNWDDDGDLDDLLDD
jgi:hypothetical protein